MARILGLGCIESSAVKELIRHVNYVEYAGIDDLQTRIDGIRSLNDPDQITPWEVLQIDQFDLFEPHWFGQFRDIIVKEYGAESDVRHYDIVSNASGPARNITVKFVVYPLILGREIHRLPQSDLLKRIHSNLDFLTQRTAHDRLLIALPNPERLLQYEGLRDLFKNSEGFLCSR